jgi:DNA-binding MarR family transcriptional regulator
MNQVSNIDRSYKLSHNLSRLLIELTKDFETRALRKCRRRGHPDIRRSHTALFSNLGFGTVRLTELADRAGITQQAMGKLVKEMESIGYIKRRVDESDKRAKIIELTDKGKVLVNDSIEIVDEIIAEYTDCMGQDGVDELEQALQQAVNALGLNLIERAFRHHQETNKTAALVS